MGWRDFKSAPARQKVQNIQKPSVITPSVPSVHFIDHVNYKSSTHIDLMAFSSDASADLHCLIDQVTQHVSCAGYPWPTRFLADHTTLEREKLRALEYHIDQAVMVSDTESMLLLLEEWRRLLLSHLN